MTTTKTQEEPKIKRYELTSPEWSEDCSYLEESPDGEYIEFQDHQKVISQLQAENEKFREIIAEGVNTQFYDKIEELKKQIEEKDKDIMTLSLDKEELQRQLSNSITLDKIKNIDFSEFDYPVKDIIIQKIKLSLTDNTHLEQNKRGSVTVGSSEKTTHKEESLGEISNKKVKE